MISVRRAGVDDVGQVAAVYVTSWVATYRKLLPHGGALPTLDAAVWAARHRGQLEQGRTTLLAWDGGTPVGMASFGPDREESTLNEVYALYVLPERQGQGIGRALMDTVIAVLRSRRVGLWCALDNRRSRRFYERYGFVANGRSGVYAIGDTRLATVRYELSAQAGPGEGRLLG